MAAVSIVSTSESSFRLKVTNITKLEQAITPVHVVQDIPWQIKVFANKIQPNNNNKSLGISLICATSDPTQSWSQAASFSCALVPFDGTANVMKRVSEPQAFNCNTKSITISSVVEWSDLMDVAKNLVNADAIQLDIVVDAVDPNDTQQSMLLFENTAKCCENDCFAEFKLTVVNVKHLMAVRTPKFLLRGLLWDFSIYKDSSAHLAIQFGLCTTSNKVSCNIKMTSKLNTSKKNIKPIEYVDTKTLQRSQMTLMQKLITWKRLLDAKNGFVENDAITLQIEIKVDKPQLVDENIGTNAMRATSTSKRLKMECGICFEAIESQNLSCPPCGHVYCSECLANTANKQKVCPSCGIPITKAVLQHVFLPM